MVFFGCCRRSQRIDEAETADEELMVQVSFHTAREFLWKKLLNVQTLIEQWLQNRRHFLREPCNSDWDELMILVNNSKLMIEPCRAASYRIEEWLGRARGKGRQATLTFILSALQSIQELVSHPRGATPAWEYSKVVMAVSVLVSSALQFSYGERSNRQISQGFEKSYAARHYELIGDFKGECKRSIMETICICQRPPTTLAASLIERSLRAVKVVIGGFPDPIRKSLLLVKVCGSIERCLPSIRIARKQREIPHLHYRRYLSAASGDLVKRIEFEKVNVELADPDGIRTALLRAQSQVFAAAINSNQRICEAPTRTLCAWTDLLGGLLLDSEHNRLPPELQTWIICGERGTKARENMRVRSDRLLSLSELASVGSSGRSTLVSRADEVFSASVLDEGKSVVQVGDEHARTWKAMADERVLSYLWDEDKRLDQLQALRSDACEWVKDQISPLLDHVDAQLHHAADAAAALLRAHSQLEHRPAVNPAEPAAVIRRIVQLQQQCHLAAADTASVTSCGCGGGRPVANTQSGVQEELRRRAVGQAASQLAVSYSTLFRTLTQRVLEHMLWAEALLTTAWVVVHRFQLPDQTRPDQDTFPEIQPASASPLAGVGPGQPSASVLALRRSLEGVQLKLDELATESVHAFAVMVRVMLRDEQPRAGPAVDTFVLRIRDVVKALVTSFGHLSSFKTECKLALLGRPDLTSESGMSPTGMGDEVVLAGFSAVFAAAARVLCCYHTGASHGMWVQQGGAAIVTEETNRPFHILKGCVDDLCEAVHYCSEELVRDCSVLQEHITSMVAAGKVLGVGGTTSQTAAVADVTTDLRQLVFNCSRVSCCLELWLHEADVFASWGRTDAGAGKPETHEARVLRTRRELKELARKVGDAGTAAEVEDLRREAKSMVGELRREEMEEKFLRTRSGREAGSRLQDVMQGLRVAVEEERRAERTQVFARSMQVQREAREIVEALKARGWEGSEAALREKLARLSGPTDTAEALRVDKIEVRASVMAEKLTMEARKLREDSSRVSGIHDAAAGWTIAKWKAQFEEYRADAAQLRRDVEELRAAGRTKRWLELRGVVAEVAAAQWRKMFMKLRMDAWDLEAACGEAAGGSLDTTGWVASVRETLAEFRAGVQVMSVLHPVRRTCDSMRSLAAALDVAGARGSAEHQEGADSIRESARSIASGLEVVKSGIYSNGSVGLHLQLYRISRAFARTARKAAGRFEQADSELASVLAELRECWGDIRALSWPSPEQRDADERVEAARMFVQRSAAELSFVLFERLTLHVAALAAAFDRATAAAGREPTTVEWGGGQLPTPIPRRSSTGSTMSRSSSAGAEEDEPDLSPEDFPEKLDELKQRISQFVVASSDLAFQGMQPADAGWVRSTLPHVEQLQHSMDAFVRCAAEPPAEALPDMVAFMHSQQAGALSAVVDADATNMLPLEWSQVRPRYAKLKPRVQRLLSDLAESAMHTEGRGVLAEVKAALEMEHVQDLLDAAAALQRAHPTAAELAPVAQQLRECAEQVEEMAESFRSGWLEQGGGQRKALRMSAEVTRAALREEQFRRLRQDGAELAQCAGRDGAEVEGWLHARMAAEMRAFWSMLCEESPLCESQAHRTGSLGVLTEAPRLLRELETGEGRGLNPKFLKETKRIRNKLLKLSGDAPRDPKQFLSELVALFRCRWSHRDSACGHLARISSEAARSWSADARDEIQALLQQVQACIAGGGGGLQDATEDSGSGAQYVVSTLQRGLWSGGVVDEEVAVLARECMLEDAQGDRSDEGPEDRLVARALPRGVGRRERKAEGGEDGDDGQEAELAAIKRAMARREHREVREYAAFVLLSCSVRAEGGSGGEGAVKRRCEEILELRRRLEDDPRVRRMVVEGAGFVHKLWSERSKPGAAPTHGDLGNTDMTAADSGHGGRWGRRLGQALDERWRCLKRFQSTCQNPFLAVDVACEEAHMRSAQHAGTAAGVSLAGFVDDRLRELAAKLDRLSARPVIAGPVSNAVLDRQFGDLSRQVAQVAQKVDEATVAVAESAGETKAAVAEGADGVQARVSELERRIAEMEGRVTQTVQQQTRAVDQIGEGVSQVGEGVADLSKVLVEVGQGVQDVRRDVTKLDGGVSDLTRGVAEIERSSKQRSEAPTTFAPMPSGGSEGDAARAKAVVAAVEARVGQMQERVLAAAAQCEGAARGVDQTIAEFNRDHQVIKEAGDAVRQSVSTIGGIVERAELACSTMEATSLRSEESADKAAAEARAMAAAAAKGQAAAEVARKEGQYLREAAAKAQEDCDVMRQAARHTQEVVKVVRKGAERGERAAERAAQHATVLAQAALQGQQAATVAAEKAAAMSAAADKGCAAAERAGVQAEKMAAAAMVGERAVGSAAGVAEEARDKVTAVHEELQRGLTALEERLEAMDAERRAAHGEREQAGAVLKQAEEVMAKGLRMQETQRQVAQLVREELDKMRVETAAETATTTAQLMQHAVAKLSASIEEAFMADGRDKLQVLQEDIDKVIAFNQEWLRLVKQSPYHWGHDAASKVQSKIIDIG